MSRDDAVRAVAEALHAWTCDCGEVDTGEFRETARHAVDAAAPHLTDQWEPLYRQAIRERDALAGMVEWLSEIVVDARDACQRAEGIEPMGSADWVASGIAMRKTALREVRQVLDRERLTNPSRYDQAIRERDEALAAIARVEAVVEEYGDDYEPEDRWRYTRDLLAALRGDA